MFVELITFIISLLIQWVGMMGWGWGPWGYGWGGPMMLFGLLWFFLWLLVFALMIIFIAWALKRMGILK